MSTLTATAGPELAPLLVSSVRSLHDCFEATVRFIQAYCLVEARVRLGEGISDSVLDPQDCMAAAETEWDDLQAVFSRNSALSARLKVPPFEAVWPEATKFQHATSGKDLSSEDFHAYYFEVIDYNGLPVFRSVMAVFEFLRSIPDLTSWIDIVLSVHPRCTDEPDNVRDQKQARGVLGFDTLPDLANAVEDCISSQDCIVGIDHIFWVFAEMVHSASNYALAVRNGVPHPTLDEVLKRIWEEHHRSVSHPFSEIPMWARRRLSEVNVRGTFSLLLMDTAELIGPGPRQRPPEELHWHMFKKFVNGVMHVANTNTGNAIDNARSALHVFGLKGFLDPTAQPIPNWTCDAFDDPNASEEDEFAYDSDDDFNPDGLPDVCFEPAGPLIKVESHAVAVAMNSELTEDDCSICRDTLNVSETKRDEVPVKIPCGHCFHYGCLATLINGISKFSNLCPNCRQEVCKRREKRLKSDEQLDSVREEDIAGPTATDGVADRDPDLHDREGDVVMTDP